MAKTIRYVIVATRGAFKIIDKATGGYQTIPVGTCKMRFTKVVDDPGGENEVDRSTISIVNMRSKGDAIMEPTAWDELSADPDSETPFESADQAGTNIGEAIIVAGA